MRNSKMKELSYSQQMNQHKFIIELDHDQASILSALTVIGTAVYGKNLEDVAMGLEALKAFGEMFDDFPGKASEVAKIMSNLTGALMEANKMENDRNERDGQQLC